MIRRTGLAGLALVAAAMAPPTAAARGEPRDTLRPATAFAGIADRRARSIAIFGEMSKVLTSPRCLNCHPRGDRPTQGDAMLPHDPPVARGADGFGVAGLACATCHGPRNAPFADAAGSVPGNPKWQLAPRSMAWQGLAPGQICLAMRDPARNGGKSLAALIEHNGSDALVGWGWQPGDGRRPAPGTQAAFGALTRAWVASGARCPA